ncbi:MAG: biotin carboxylase N-terminal domain-containing protein [Holophaga sp.]|nr:biotin carboxylase N-terminal domain-containing protein [Holophaga sp.]
MTARRLVIANRGEIARRILRAGRAMGYQVAVVSTAQDEGARVRREADAVLPVASFLDIPGIVAACLEWGGTLLHPGYGFLSEQAEFAQAVEDARIGFVGPSPASMRALGRKEAARALAKACGVPVLEALLSHELAALPPDQWAGALAGRGIRAPFLVKASGGGGGRGMRVVAEAGALPEAVRRAALEAGAAFGDGAVFVERYLEAPRHVEIQVFGDGRGGGVFLGERECSLQRRHQKVLEEAPSPAADPELRAALGRAALALVRETRYRGAGTVEFLLDPERAWYFLEVNTRIQVEHPVTELAFGLDLVQAQLELAEGRWPAALGDPGRFAPPEPRGVALEARILAEDPRNGFLPTPGPLQVYREPRGEGIRVDSGVAQGDRVDAQFDSLIAKLVVWGPDRPAAVARLGAALEAFTVLGTLTNLPLLQAICRAPDFLAAELSTRWIQDHLAELNAPLLPAPCLAFLASPGFREALAGALRGMAPARGPAGRFQALDHPELKLGGGRDQPGFTLDRTGEHRFTLRGPGLGALLAGPHGPHQRGRGLEEALGCQAPELSFIACRLPGSDLALSLFGETLVLEDPTARPAGGGQAALGPVLAPMAGKVLEVHVAAGDPVEPGQLLFVLESMKMQFEIAAPRKGRVLALRVAPGQILQGPEQLALLGE